MTLLRKIEVLKYKELILSCFKVPFLFLSFFLIPLFSFEHVDGKEEKRNTYLECSHAMHLRDAAVRTKEPFNVA